MSELKLSVQQREPKSSNANRRLRAAGILPAVVYGDHLDPVPIQLEKRVLHELMSKGGNENAVFQLQLEGSEESRHVMIRQLDVDPISRQIVHVDFQRINLTEKVRVMVQIELEGEPAGVKNDGGVLDFISREVEVECLPTAIPSSIEVDVSALHIGDHIEAGQLELPEGVELIEEPDRVIASVAHSRVEAEIEEIDAEAAEEGLLEATAEEPELIGREREDDDADDDEDSD